MKLGTSRLINLHSLSRHGLKQYVLSEQFGLSGASLSKWEAAVESPESVARQGLKVLIDSLQQNTSNVLVSGVASVLNLALTVNENSDIVHLLHEAADAAEDPDHDLLEFVSIVLDVSENVIPLLAQRRMSVYMADIRRLYYSPSHLINQAFASDLYMQMGGGNFARFVEFRVSGILAETRMIYGLETVLTRTVVSSVSKLVGRAVAALAGPYGILIGAILDAFISSIMEATEQS